MGSFAEGKFGTLSCAAGGARRARATAAAHRTGLAAVSSAPLLPHRTGIWHLGYGTADCRRPGGRTCPQMAQEIPAGRCLGTNGKPEIPQNGAPPKVSPFRSAALGGCTTPATP